MAVTAAQLQQLYLAYFGRPADFNGIVTFTSNPAFTEASVAQAFSTSPESIALYGATFGPAQINAIYMNLFNRPAEPAGLLHWATEVASGRFTPAGAALAIAQNAQNADKTAVANKLAIATAFTASLTTTAQITGYSGDAAAASARAFLATVTDTAASVTAATTGMAAAVAAATAGGGATGQTFTLTTAIDSLTGTSGNDTFVATHSTLSITDSVAGGAGTDTLLIVDSGTAALTIPAITVSGVENLNIRNVNGTAAVTEVAERQAVIVTGAPTADGNTSFLGINTAVLAADTAAGVATKIIANKATILAGAAATNAGITDLVAGGAGEIIVVYGGTAGKGDVAAMAAAGPSNGSSFSAGIEQTKGVLAVAAAQFADTVNAANFAGVTQFNSSLSTGDVVVQNLSATQQVGAQGNGSTVLGNVSYTLGGTVTAQTLNFMDGTVGTGKTFQNTGATVATATINSKGAANSFGTVDLGTGTATTALTVNAETNLTITALAADYAATAALTVSGAATSVNLGAGATANFKTIDASGMTAGGLTIAVGSNLTSFKGGVGADTVTTGALTTNTAGVVDAGAGTDILNVADATTADTAAETANYVNFETLRNSGATDIDVSLFSGITAVQVAGVDAGATRMTAAQAASVRVLATNTTNTFALTTATGTADVLGLTLQNLTAAAVATPIDVTAATVTGFETLNVVSSSGTKGGAASAGNDLAFAAAGDVTAINVSGEYDLSLNTAGLAKAVTIASTQTGTANFNVTGALVRGSSFTGSANADTIVVTAAAAGGAGDFVTYNGGAGNDAISATLEAVNNTSGATASVKIDGGAGTDTLTFTDANGLTAADANFQHLTNIEAIKYQVANKAISITSGGFFDTNFKTAGVTLTLGDATNAQVNTVDLTSFTGKATVALTANAATTQAQTIKTGTGNDSVTLSATSLTNVTGGFAINTGAGDDTIAVTVSAALATAVNTINGGLGKDSLTLTGVDAADTALISYVVNAGHSTLTAYDSITGGAVAAGGIAGTLLNFDGSAVAASDVTSAAVTGFTSGELTISVAAGRLTFAGTSAAGLTLAQKATIAQTAITAANATVVFADGANSYVFHNDTAGDSLVELVGVAALGLGAGSTTNGHINVG
jgi:S-layer protein